MEQANATPAVYLKPQRDKSVRRRHPWIFSGAIGSGGEGVEPGASVRVLSHAGEFLAWASWSPQSQIRLRIWSFDEAQSIDSALIERRLEQAIGARRALGLMEADACRLVFGESDGLPGLVVDRYGNHLVCQFLAASSERWRDAVVAQLARALRPRGIYERSDSAVRKKEGLPPRQGLLSGDAPSPRLELRLDGLRELFDLANGQKTGGYLDQRFNRLRVASHANGARVLDAYCYSGGFGLRCLAAGAVQATFVDSSAQALDAVVTTAELNGLAERSRVIHSDVAQALRSLREAGARFDLIVLDPPKFVHTAAQLTKGCRAYKDINRLAFELLSPGGILASFSCSGHVDSGMLQTVIAQAAAEAERSASIIEFLSQAPDHPVALSFPESHYLNGFILRA